MQRTPRVPTLPLGSPLGQSRYRIIKKLGKGAYGSVYLAQDTRLGDHQVAIKELLEPSPEAHQLFHREATLLASLNHPGLVRVSDFFSEGRSHYLVMDYIEGRDLREIVVEAESSHQLLPADQVIAWIMQVCEAVAYLHHRTPPIIHRDIKPANIRLSTEGRAILVDFGIAKVDPKSTTMVMAKAVTVGFSPPEQYDGGSGTDARSDVYALGATLYCMLALKSPPDGFERLIRGTPLMPPSQINPAVSVLLEEIVLKAMALDGPDRYEDANEMLQALRSATVPLVAPQIDTPLVVSPSRIKCPRCGNLCRPDARFCPRCGTAFRSIAQKLSQQCPTCGTITRVEARYCPKCGTQLTTARLEETRVTPQLGDANRAHWHVTQGDRLSEAGRFADAAREYEQALNLGADSPALYAGLGNCYMQMDRTDEAVRMLETAARRYPQDAAIHAQLSMAYMEAGQPIQGIQMLDRAHQLSPDDNALGLRLIRTSFYADQLGVAERVVKEMQRKNPRLAEMPFWMGMINLTRGQPAQALHDFQQALNLSPDHALAHYFVGEIYFQQQHWADAVTAYQACAQANPHDIGPHLKMGQCFIQMKRPAEAGVAVQQALRIDPNDEMANRLAVQLRR